MTTRRRFIHALAGAGVSLPVMRGSAFRNLLEAEPIAADRSPTSVAEDETYWREIQRAFDLDRTMINLNNGGCSPAPTHVLEQMIRDLRFSNELPVDHMWRVLEPRIESVRRDLAQDFGCDPEEMAITRNASEANETMIFGLDLKKGDEVIFTTQNYPRMQTAWRQRARREGIVLKPVKIETPVKSTASFVEHIASAITPQTRVIEVMHISFMTGYIAPVREIVDLAKPKGIQVFVDGAHAFAHFPFTRDELGCDYYGTSLHKWLHAPIGTGFLYVRRDKIKSLWPLMAASVEQDANIRKYEEIGTHPAANHNAIAVAIAFTRGIGMDRKIARLRYLRDRWAKQLLAGSDRVHMITEIGPTKSGAIGVYGIDGMDMGKLGGWLFSQHNIVTTPMVNDEFAGMRVTPNVYTTVDEVDLFADRVLKAIRSGIA
ncbi:MAG TPA: aminotransferase class V-fold PLP-dependent enzyme [Gemmatimonadaceae bacterium]|jgi:selenocysteine lyase/cysteine desulfurase|nr:aminotransferase class V-fold PLP-dependent enzyme [Gemmatimonadaceae bacterium]HTK51562.1 aminotransferase class V-fold PLP-dependent enzyme [Gemmatimonadaceae bacterium]